MENMPGVHIWQCRSCLYPVTLSAVCRTFSPHKQDCITQGGGKDQVLPFLNLPLCRFRSYLKGRRSGRDMFLQPAISGVCGRVHDPGPGDCHQQFHLS